METTPPVTEAAAPMQQQQPAGSASQSTGMAILAYLGILILIPFLTEAHKEEFVKFHIKQGLALIIMEIAASIIAVIPVLGWVISPILWIGALVFLIMGIVNAASGKTKELPLIGQLAHQFKF